MAYLLHGHFIDLKLNVKKFDSFLFTIDALMLSLKGVLNIVNPVKFCIFFIFLLCGCLQKNVNTSVYVVKSPEWVADVNNDDYYTVGVKDKDVLLMTAFSCAKKNVIDSLKVDIFIKLEDVFLSETVDITADEKAYLLSDFDKKMASNMTSSYLSSVVRFDDIWRSPDDGILYVRFFVDRANIVSKISSLLDELKGKYKNNDELKEIIENIKNNIINNGFKIKNINSDRKNVFVSKCDYKKNTKKIKDNIFINTNELDSKIRNVIDSQSSKSN